MRISSQKHVVLINLQIIASLFSSARKIAMTRTSAFSSVFRGVKFILSCDFSWKDSFSSAVSTGYN